MGQQLLSVIIVVWGIIILIGTLFKQDFYWGTARIQHSRKMFGDRAAAILHGGVGLLMIIVGLWMIFG